jgi:DNA repair protein RadA/Sms
MGGVPGAGKSTMMQQILDQISETTKKETLYIGKEEDAEQVKDRGARLGLRNMHLMRILPVDKQEGGIDLPALFKTYSPVACCVDSVTAYADSQADQVSICKMLKEYAVKYRCPCFVIGHVTKGEEFGGEMGLQHAVDGTHMLYNEQCKVPVMLDGVVYTEVRVLRTEKNRNGTSGAKVDTFYVMTQHGLKQVYDPELADEEDDDVRRLGPGGDDEDDQSDE